MVQNVKSKDVLKRLMKATLTSTTLKRLKIINASPQNKHFIV
jgi:hypothetical protein